jgi:ribosome-associated protein
MRISDIDNIQETLEKMDHQSLTYRQHFQRLEAWRDSLINEGNQAIENFLSDYPMADRQQLRNLQRQANRELELKKPPAAARKMFQYIRSLTD